MRGGEFLRRLKRLGDRKGVEVRFIAYRGKGSHGTVYFGHASTILKDRRKEIGVGLLHRMCSDLGVEVHEL